MRRYPRVLPRKSQTSNPLAPARRRSNRILPQTRIRPALALRVTSTILTTGNQSASNHRYRAGENAGPGPARASVVTSGILKKSREPVPTAVTALSLSPVMRVVSFLPGTCKRRCETRLTSYASQSSGPSRPGPGCASGSPPASGMASCPPVDHHVRASRESTPPSRLRPPCSPLL